MATYSFVYGVGRWCVFAKGKLIAQCTTIQEAIQVAEDYNELHLK